MPRFNVTHAVWYKPSTGSVIGAVLIQKVDGKVICKIGNGRGWDQNVDSQIIAEGGAEVSKEVAMAIFPEVNYNFFT